LSSCNPVHVPGAKNKGIAVFAGKQSAPRCLEVMYHLGQAKASDFWRRWVNWVRAKIVGIWGQTPPEAPKRGFSLASDPVNHPQFWPTPGSIVETG
jgi:hypothetical protein